MTPEDATIKIRNVGSLTEQFLQARYLGAIFDSSNTSVFLLNQPANHVIILLFSLVNELFLFLPMNCDKFILILMTYLFIFIVFITLLIKCKCLRVCLPHSILKAP